MDTSKLETVEKTLICVLGTLETLYLRGMVARSEGAERLTDKGMALYYALKAEGYSPTQEEIGALVHLFKGEPPDDEAPFAPAPPPQS